MKSLLTVLFAGAKMPHAFDPAFDGKSAFDRALAWAASVPGSVRTVVFTDGENRAKAEAACGGAAVSFVQQDDWTNALVAESLAASCAEHQADCAVFAWADCPFLNAPLTAELVETHTKYRAEYTFADGYPYGLTPEVVDAGAARIIAGLGKGVQQAAGDRPAARDALFAIMSGDINAFEIETVIAPKDYRMLRLDFSCGEKLPFLACARLYAVARDACALEAADFDACALSDRAGADESVLRTVPAFYNVQVAARYNHDLVYVPYRQLTAAHPLDDMAFADFQSLVAQMAALSETAVVSLSAFGEPLLHPRFADCVREVLSYPGLSVFIETDGTLVTESLAADLARLDARRIVWVVLLDAAERALYARLHRCDEGDFSRAVAAVGLLERHFPHRVYPQMTRMKANEPQLEQFYRHWKDKGSASAGELIVQKYNRFCGVLPDEQSADLSPLVRMPCWHLRRDMTILSDGSVPFCVSRPAGAAAGNALSEGITAVWERFSGPLAAQVKKDYPPECETCDEFYTFNF